MRLPWIVLLTLAGCGSDISLTKTTVDNDSDGYAAEVDCDDAHATVNPDAEELCDELDNDCDGEVDEGVSAATWYTDGDGDGYGDEATVAEGCAAPAGAALQAGDCDDAEARAFPGNPELCDGLDNDCDGAIDDDPSDVGTFYTDADGDGYGDPDTPVSACSAEAGQVEQGGDCDDAEPAIHPDAAEADCADPVDYNCDGSVGYADADDDGVPACEDCDDGSAARSPENVEICDDDDADEDCDGAADDEDASASGERSWYRDADGDTYGGASATSACDQPVGYVDNQLDCDDTSAAISPAEAEICDDDDTDEDCDGAADDEDASASGERSWYRDADGDSYGGATTRSACDQPSGYVANTLDCDDDDASVNPAGAEVCGDDIDQDCSGEDESCPVGGDYAGSYDVNSGYDTKIYGSSAGDGLGALLATGDFNGDGVGDLVTGSPHASPGSADGGLYGYYGPFTAGAWSAESHDDFVYTNSGTVSSSFFGIAVNLGDLSGDGADDLAAVKSSGTWLLFEGGDTGSGSYGSRADATLSCYGVARAGSALGADDAWLCGDHVSSSVGSVVVMDGVSGTGSATITGESAGDKLGWAMAGGEDIDGDGVDDLLLGTPYVDGSTTGNAGAIYLIYGPPSGSLSAADADVRILGDATTDYFGAMVLLAGDMDDDGYADPVAAAPESELGGATAGAVYLFTSPESGAASGVAETIVVGEDSYDVITESGLDAADLSGDGHLDLLIGSIFSDDAATDAGCVWLFYDLPSGTLSAGSADAEWRGPKSADYAGIVKTIPDADDDGRAELAIVGEAHDYGSGSSSATDRGAVWIWPGM